MLHYVSCPSVVFLGMSRPVHHTYASSYGPVYVVQLIGGRYFHYQIVASGVHAFISELPF